MAIAALLGGYAIPCVLLAVLVLACVRVLPVKMDVREPPFKRSTVPYIGHLVGLLQHQFGYLSMLRCVAWPFLETVD